MDPQACLQRIFDAVKAGDNDELYWAFQDLANWLVKGGTRPVLVSLETEAPLPYTDRERVNLNGRSLGAMNEAYTIQTKDPHNRTGHGPYEFVVYLRDEPRFRCDLPME